jgi:putative heme uptake system protein
MTTDGVDGATPRRLLVWDAPNIDVALGTLLGGRAPRPEERPRFDALARWLVDRTPDDEVPEASVFINIPPERIDAIRGFVEMLRGTGFSVYARPKLTEGDDIDQALLDHLRERAASTPLAEVLLASADQYRDAGDDSLADLAGRLPLTVLGFREFNRAAITMDGVAFIDLEDIPGLFEVPLDRETPLEALPPEGAWLPARRSLREIHG